MTRHPITVGELVAILQTLDQNLPVQMSMNMEYQSLVCNNMVEVFTRDDGSQYCLITDTPDRDWDEDYLDSNAHLDYVDEAQEWHDFDPDC